MLFADCIPVKGAQRATICDVGRGKLYIIPQSMYYFIEEFEGHSLHQLMDLVDKNNREILEEYINCLEDNELIFWCNEEETKLFPKMKKKWASPSLISNAIIEFNHNYTYDIAMIELNELGCSYFQLRLASIDLDVIACFTQFLAKLIQHCPNLNMFEVLLPHHSEVMDEMFLNSINKYVQLRCVTFYNHTIDLQTTVDSLCIKHRVDNLNNSQEKSAVSFSSFFLNSEFFFESRLRNPYYNGKVTIDIEGNIKNTINDMESFGNICSDTIISAINKPHFKTLWYSSKDQIEGCQNCEFRYICFDTRPIIFDRINNIYKSTTPCNYDPYTARWNLSTLKSHSELV